MKRLILLLVLIYLLVKELDCWKNSFDGRLHFICPNRQSISSISSIHNNGHEDRVWDFQCKDTFNSDPQCFWTNYVNSFDEQFTFVCPNNYVMTGMGSYHDNTDEDRRWQFHCCQVCIYCNYNCQWTPYVNNFDEQITWLVPSRNYLVGAESVHSNPHEDRRWKFYYCTRSYC